jgi:predicted ATPase
VWRKDEELEASVSWRERSDGESRFKRRADSTTGGVLGGGQYLHLDPNKMRAEHQVQQQKQLTVDGGNLASVVATMSRRRQEQLAQDLARMVPVLKDFTVQPAVKPGQHRFVFQDRWDDDVWYEPSEVSDGTLLALGLLALRYQLKPPQIVAIEEPEHGLHPFLLGEFVNFLRKLAHGELGKPLQIVMSTQSAELLEFLEPSEVRFLNRQPSDGSVTVEEAPTGSDSWREAYAAHQESLGSLWLSGSLGGIPTG